MLMRLPLLYILYNRLDAKVSGHPRPKVTWYKNGEVIRWTPDCQISYETSGISTLTVQRTQLDDFGFYACECKNAYGVDMTECELVQLGMYIKYMFAFEDVCSVIFSYRFFPIGLYIKVSLTHKCND